MIKSLWSLKVIRGSDRHLINREREREKKNSLYLVLGENGANFNESLTLQNASFKPVLFQSVIYCGLCPKYYGNNGVIKGI